MHVPSESMYVPVYMCVHNFLRVKLQDQLAKVYVEYHKSIGEES